MKLLKFGIKRLVFRQKTSSVLVKKTISGSTVLVHVVHVQRFITIVEKSMAVDNQDVPLDVTVTDIWRFGITYLHSLKMTEKATTQS